MNTSIKKYAIILSVFVVCLGLCILGVYRKQNLDKFVSFGTDIQKIEEDSGKKIDIILACLII